MTNNDRILVVDDQTNSLKQIQGVLRSAHQSFEVEQDTNRVIRLANAADAISLAIIRFRSPGIDGIDLCERLQAVRPNLHVVMIVSNSEETTLALQAGANDIILQPFTRAELLGRCKIQGRRITKRISVETTHEQTQPANIDEIVEPVLDSTPQQPAPLAGDSNLRVDPIDERFAALESQLQKLVSDGETTSNVSESSDESNTANSSTTNKNNSQVVMPKFDSATQRFVYPAEHADQIEHLANDPNVIKVELDTVLTCPDCESVPTFRHGCGSCGGGIVEQETLIHHYACACVAGEKEFREGDELVCPKCRVGNIVSGTDFEVAEGGFECTDCFETFDTTELIGHCNMCSLRFPASKAKVTKLIGYQIPAATTQKHEIRAPKLKGIARAKSRTQSKGR